jgi:hypothetical protein
MKLRYLAFLSLLGSCLMSCETTKAPSSDAHFLSSYRGFAKAGGLSNAQVYHGDSKKLASYKKVYIEPVRVIVPSDEKTTKEEIASLKTKFESELRTELGQSHTVVSHPGRKTLSIRVALVEVHPGTPALFLAGYAPYAGAVSTAIGVATGTNPGSGATSVQAEVVDSWTREQFFAVIDRDQAAKWEPAQGLTRWGQAEASFRKWSSQIRKELAAPGSGGNLQVAEEKPAAPVEVSGTKLGKS